MTNIKLIFIFLSLINYAYSQCMEPYCYCLNQNTLLCTNFTSFNQLDFTRLNSRLFEKVELKPLVSEIDLNENLKLNGLKLNGKLSLSNIRSLTAFYNPFKQILYDKLDLAFYNSNFNFVNVQNINIINECSLGSTSSLPNLDYIFSDLKLNEFTLCNIYFNKPMCPLIFRNTLIKNMIITDPYGAFGFMKIKPAENVLSYLNVNINKVDFSYGVDSFEQPQWLDADTILNPDLFIYLDRININSARRLAYIQEDTFKILPLVKKFEINNVRLKDLLTYNRRWLKNLNSRSNTYDMETIRLNSTLANEVFQFIVWINDDWDFNDEKDICLFKSFPHNKLVFPFLLFSKPTLPCTCTIYWLYKYFSKYQEIYNLNQNIAPFHCFSQPNWDKCQFEALFNRYCPSNVQEPDESYTTLRPSIDFMTFTTSQTTLQTISQTSSTLFPTIPTRPTTNNPNTQSTSSSLAITQDREKLCRYSEIAFYLAIALAILAVLIIAALVVLYYLVFKQSRKNNNKKLKMNENKSADVADSSLEYI